MKKLFHAFVLFSGLQACVLLAAPVQLQVDKTKSKVDVDVKVTMDSFVGSLSAYEAAIVMDSVTGKVESTVVGFKFADVKTGKEKRDKKMNEWQGTDTYANGVFRLETIVAGPTANSFVATGKLSFHGMDLPLSFPLTIERKESAVSIKGEAVVDTVAYGLPVIKMMAMLKVDPKVTIRFDLEGTLPAAK